MLLDTQCGGVFSTFLHTSWTTKLLECKSSSIARTHIAAHVISRTRLSPHLMCCTMYMRGREPRDEAMGSHEVKIPQYLG